MIEMIEKLYCPDFSAIFDERFANPFVYAPVDSLQWPLLVDLPMDAQAKELVALKDERKHEVFYHRKITSGQWEIERQCVGTGHVLFQACYIDADSKITNEQVIATCNAMNGLASAIICPDLGGDDVAYMEEHAASIAGVVFYPLYQEIDFDGQTFGDIVAFCNQERLPIKLDFYEFKAPKEPSFQVILPDILDLLGKNENILIIISGLDISGIQIVSEKMKHNPRLWLEIDPRIVGGMHPAGLFSKIFALPGFIQNCWDRIILGSATPTLEASQVIRGLWDATEPLPFQLKCLLRTWLPRNALRAFKLPLDQLAKSKVFSTDERFTCKETARTIVDLQDHKQAIIDFETSLQSFAITQLLWLQPMIESTWVAVKAEFPSIETGDLLIRTYHTTTSLIMNEHERGNFLQLHYDFAQKTRDDPSDKLHTVAAEENRADFNYPDHILATSVGDRNLILPIVGDKLDIGGRENIYVLVTFGPRGIKLKLRFTFYFA